MSQSVGSPKAVQKWVPKIDAVKTLFKPKDMHPTIRKVVMMQGQHN